MQIIKASFKILDQVDGEAILAKIERAARTCYKSEDKITATSAHRIVAKLIANGHESALEHEKLTVRIICDRGVSHEIVRHRIASYSQESTRYCDYGKEGEITVIEPPGLGDHRPYWLAAMRDAERAYNQLRCWKIPPQIARSVLPNSLKTEIVCTMNMREFRHFFRLRTAKDAHPQMREITVPMLKKFRELIPVLFDDVGEVD
jgi:thymidylate synthase (FAD)